MEPDHPEFPTSIDELIEFMRAEARDCESELHQPLSPPLRAQHERDLRMYRETERRLIRLKQLRDAYGYVDR
jgi:hypothetical protein